LPEPILTLTINSTSGGKGGETVTVNNLSALTTAVADTTPRIVVVSGTISGAAKVLVGSNKSIIGRNSGHLVGIGLFLNHSSNVIIRNTIHSKVPATYEDAITVKYSTNVWVDHVDVSNDRDHDKDYYDGLVDVTRASVSPSIFYPSPLRKNQLHKEVLTQSPQDFVTISNSYLHDHWKGSLVGHSDNNQAEDTGHLYVPTSTPISP
jgi:pectate lyase